MISFSFLNPVEAFQFRLNSIKIRGDESVIVVSMNHPEEIHNHHIPSGKSFWNVDIAFWF